ncbi:MAG: hypothetical protein R2706_20725 [Acidimicrobiales bacterium]
MERAPKYLPGIFCLESAHTYSVVEARRSAGDVLGLLPWPARTARGQTIRVVVKDDGPTALRAAVPALAWLLADVVCHVPTMNPGCDSYPLLMTKVASSGPTLLTSVVPCDEPNAQYRANSRPGRC